MCFPARKTREIYHNVTSLQGHPFGGFENSKQPVIFQPARLANFDLESCDNEERL